MHTKSLDLHPHAYMQQHIGAYMHLPNAFSLAHFASNQRRHRSTIERLFAEVDAETAEIGHCTETCTHAHTHSHTCLRTPAYAHTHHRFIHTHGHTASDTKRARADVAYTFHLHICRCTIFDQATTLASLQPFLHLDYL